MTAYVVADTPARGNDARGRKPYLIQNILDIKAQIAINGADYAAGDTEQVLNVPKGTVVLSSGIEIVESSPSGTATVDLGYTGGTVDLYIDGLDIVGGASGTYGITPGTEAAQIQVIIAADTIDLKFVTEGALTAGKLRIWAVCMDITDIGGVEPLEAARDFA